MPSQALAGVRILDLSRILAAPFASQLLGDLGAEVIKIERPGKGDDARYYGPPFLDTGDANCQREAAFYLSCNRNKKSVTIDHSKEEGRALLLKLAAKSDVVLENFRTGVLAKYGLDYEGIKAVNPGIIYCSVTGFGQDGPYAQRPGYDGVFQAMSGMMAATGLPDGVPGGGPTKIGISMVDILTGFYASNAILAALYHRDAKGGEGQHIDLALLDCGVASLSHFAQNYLVSGEVPPRRGNGGFGGIPSQTFQCADTHIFLTAGTEKQYMALCDVLGAPQLATDSRFATGPDRIANREALLAALDHAFAKQSAAHWLTALDAADVPASAVNTLPQVFENPQVQHRKMLRTIAHPTAGTMDILANPIRMSGTPIGAYQAPPMLGQHNEEALGELLGLDTAAISGLRAGGVI